MRLRSAWVGVLGVGARVNDRVRWRQQANRRARLRMRRRRRERSGGVKVDTSTAGDVKGA